MKKFIVLVAVLALPGWVSAQVAFSLTSALRMGSNSVAIAMGDVNHDGWRDLLVRDGGSVIMVLTNNGNGKFGSNNTFSAVAFLNMTTADINGDGYCDIIGTDGAFGTGHVFVYTNDGSGNFGSNASYAVGSVPTAPTVADINNDGWLDIICPNAAAGKLSVLTNNGSGGFSIASSPTTGTDGNPGVVTVADINNDGVLELVCPNSGSPIYGTTLSVLTNAGKGVFKLSKTPTVCRAPGSLVALDVNGDGFVDLLCTSGMDKQLVVMTNNKSGSFGSNTVISVSARSSLTLSDFNADHSLDFISFNLDDGKAVVFTNNGSGIFGSNATLVVARPAGSFVEDMNGDGRPDIICVNDGLHPVSAYTSRSSISFFIGVPVLASQISGPNLRLSWPTAWTNWTLVQSADISGNWTGYNGIIGSDGTNNTATNSMASGNVFFRLTHP